MATRKIGLSLGADICWPICYENLVRRLDLAIPVEGETVSFEVERVRIEPFSLRQPCRYDLVIDRLTHWYYPSREWTTCTSSTTHGRSSPWRSTRPTRP